MAIVKVQGESADDRFPPKTLKRLSKLLRKRSAKVSSVARTVSDIIDFPVEYETSVFIDLPSEKFDLADFKQSAEFTYAESDEDLSAEKRAFETLVGFLVEDGSIFKEVDSREQILDSYKQLVEEDK